MSKSRSLKIWTLILLTGFIFSCKSQENVSSLSTSSSDSIDYLLKGDYKFVRHDRLGNHYILTSDNKLIKYDKDWKKLFHYSFNRLGTVETLDVTNPQKILLYFFDFQTILFLDNTLSEIKRLNLEDVGFWDITGVAVSRDNAIWIYDAQNYNMIKIDDSGREILRSNEQYFGELSDEYQINLAVDQNNVVAYSPKEAMFYNIIGEHLNTFPLESQYITLWNGQIIYLKANSIYVEKIEVSFSESQQLLYQHQSPINDFSISGNVLYAIDSDGIFEISMD